MPRRARKNPLKRFFSVLGPGLTTGAADNDPSGIATYSIAGAQLGTSLLWTALVTWPLMAFIQLMCARIGMVTGRGLANMRFRADRPGRRFKTRRHETRLPRNRYGPAPGRQRVAELDVERVAQREHHHHWRRSRRYVRCGEDADRTRYTSAYDHFRSRHYARRHLFSVLPNRFNLEMADVGSFRICYHGVHSQTALENRVIRHLHSILAAGT